MPFVEVFGSQMHYTEAGEGDPILFLHGNPTSSYLWRNVIPHVTHMGHCIAPDLIGMGLSDKPKLDYTFHDHYRYLEEFIKQLDLKNITLVLHDWGGPLGLTYAHSHESNIRAIAFMETMVRMPSWEMMPNAQWKVLFRMFRAPVIGTLLNQGLNFFVTQLIPKAVIRKLSKEEMHHYSAPYPSFRSRKPAAMWPKQIPLGGKPTKVFNTLEPVFEWFKGSEEPKLHLYATPGGLMPAPVVEWCRSNLHNLQSVQVGKGIHYIQEDCPDEIGTALANWVTALHPSTKH